MARWREGLSHVEEYVSKNGFTLLLDVSGQQSNVMWAVPSTDVTQAVVTAYNTVSGVAAPAPSGPSTPADYGSTTSFDSEAGSSEAVTSLISRFNGRGGPHGSPLCCVVCFGLSTGCLWKNLWIADEEKR